MFCSMCGAKSVNGGKYCIKCGNPLAHMEEKQHTDSQNENENYNASASGAIKSSQALPFRDTTKMMQRKGVKILLIAISALVIIVALLNRGVRLSGTWVHAPGVSQKDYYVGDRIITRTSETDGRQEYIFSGNTFLLSIQRAPLAVEANPLVLRYNGRYSIRRDKGLSDIHGEATYVIEFKHSAALSSMDNTVLFSRVDRNTITIDGLIFTRQR